MAKPITKRRARVFVRQALDDLRHAMDVTPAMLGEARTLRLSVIEDELTTIIADAYAAGHIE